MLPETTVKIDIETKSKLDCLAKTFGMNKKKTLRLLIESAYNEHFKLLLGVKE
jgi:predicted DNA-binding protein